MKKKKKKFKGAENFVHCPTLKKKKKILENYSEISNLSIYTSLMKCYDFINKVTVHLFLPEILFRKTHQRIYHSLTNCLSTFLKLLSQNLPTFFLHIQFSSLTSGFHFRLHLHIPVPIRSDSKKSSARQKKNSADFSAQKTPLAVYTVP